MNQIPAFFDPKYRCFCGKCHVKTATKILCYIFISLIIFSTIFTAFFHPSNLNSYTTIADLIFASVFVMTLYGIKTEQHVWLIPYLITTSIGIAFATVFMFIPVMYLIFNPEESHRFIPKKNSWGDDIEYTLEELMEPIPTKIILSRAFLQFIIVILHLWFLFIVFRCFQFLRAKKEAEKNVATNNIPFYTNPAVSSFVHLPQYSHTA